MKSEKLPQINTDPLQPYIIHNVEGIVCHEKRGDRFSLDLGEEGLVPIVFTSTMEKTRFRMMIGESVQVKGWALAETLKDEFNYFLQFLFIKNWKLI
jgi:hypothetical protein